MSRPPKPIDWKKVDHLLMAGCEGTEIAPHFDMHHDTFYARVFQEYNLSFTAYSSLKKQQGDSLLKTKQFDKALKEDNTMLIWLGKQRLGQKDSHEEKLPPNESIIAHLLDEIKSLKQQLEPVKQESNATIPQTDPVVQPSEPSI